MLVETYFNLHKKLFSVRACEGPDKGRVIAHRKAVCLLNVKFKVSEAGRQRVLREQRKNVHAVMRGHWIRNQKKAKILKDKVLRQGANFTYDPYVMETFCVGIGENQTPLHDALAVYVNQRKGEKLVLV